MVGLVGVILVMLASGQLPDDKVNVPEAMTFANEAPMWLGLALRRRRRRSACAPAAAAGRSCSRRPW